MAQLEEGRYFDDQLLTHNYKGILVTDTAYKHEYVDWHFHENPYFTYLLEGLVIEENKSERYTLIPGSLLFHNWDDEHRNIKPPGYTRGFHLEIQKR